MSALEPGNNIWEIIHVRKRIFDIGHQRMSDLKITGIAVKICYNHVVEISNKRKFEIKYTRSK